MKNAPYSIIELLKTSDFTERMRKIKANVEYLKLGPIQSKKYFESVAELSQFKNTGENWLILYRYHK